MTNEPRQQKSSFLRRRAENAFSRKNKKHRQTFFSLWVCLGLLSFAAPRLKMLRLEPEIHLPAAYGKVQDVLAVDNGRQIRDRSPEW